MIIKGKARSDGAQLARYLLAVGKNERIGLVELEGVCSLTLKAALIEMETVARGSRCSRPFYHAQIAPAEGEALTPEQRRRAIDLFVEKMGLQDQPRAVVEHVRDGRTHLHLVVLRVDGVTLRTISDYWSYAKHEQIARVLEREFGHERVQGAFAERDGTERPKRARSHAEAQQSERSRIRPEDVAAELTLLWQLTDSGKAFKAAIERAGYILARGDGERARLVVIDQAGEIHSLRRRLKGVKVEDINRRMAGIDRAALPNVEEARAQLRARAEQRGQEHEAEQKAPPKPPPSSEDGSPGGGPSPTVGFAPSRPSSASDVSAVFAALTAKQSTFSRAELAREIERQIDPEVYDFAATLRAAEAAPELVRLGTDTRNRDRFTTTDMLATEQSMVGLAAKLARRRQYKVDDSSRAAAPSLGELNDGQRAAFDHVMRSSGLALVEGYAGTGKSRMLGAAREAWEAEGYRVIGIAPTGIAAENLSDGSGIESGTIHSALWRWDTHARLDALEARNYVPATKDRIRSEIEAERLTSRDIIVLDEAGMVGSRLMERVLAAAEKTGAKVVATFDTLQVESMSAGAAARALKERHGSIQITEVLRQREVWQQDAALDFAFGRTDLALTRYSEAGRLIGTGTRDEAKSSLIAAWAEARADHGDQTLILAYTNVDVGDLNALARKVVQREGKLGADHELIGRNGADAYAVGDRFYFLKNDRSLGVRNGSLGTITGIDGDSVRVKLDGGKTVSFDNREYQEFSHGYAATIIKSQGSTVERTFVLASEYMDRRSAYVAMSRHRDEATLYWSAEEFGGERGLVRILGRQSAKDTSLDYFYDRDSRNGRSDSAQSGPDESANPKPAGETDMPDPTQPEEELQQLTFQEPTFQEPIFQSGTFKETVDTGLDIADRGLGAAEQGFEYAVDIGDDIFSSLIDPTCTPPPPERGDNESAPAIDAAPQAAPIADATPAIAEPQPEAGPQPAQEAAPEPEPEPAAAPEAAAEPAVALESGAENAEPPTERDEFAAEMRALAAQMEQQREQERDDGMGR